MLFGRVILILSAISGYAACCVAPPISTCAFIGMCCFVKRNARWLLTWHCFYLHVFIHLIVHADAFIEY